MLAISDGYQPQRRQARKTRTRILMLFVFLTVIVLGVPLALGFPLNDTTDINMDVFLAP